MKRIYLTLILVLATIVGAQAKDYDFIVAQDGTGDFRTVQEAINAVPDFRKEKETRIYIRNGVYKEKLVLAECKINVTLIGESAAKTILMYDDFASRPNSFGENKGTSGSSSFYVYGHDFHAFNITFANYAGPVGQAVALFVAGNRAVFVGCRFLGYQDTLYTYGKTSKQYYKNCYIEGTVDFIFGSSTAFFEGCEIHSIGRGYLTAASTPEGTAYGYVFHDCRLTARPGVERVMLGRPWRPYAKTVFVNCRMGSHIAPEGWFNWGVEKEKTAFYAEAGSKTLCGKDVDVSKRVAWSKQVGAADYTIDKVLADAEKPEWYKVAEARR